MTMNPVAGVLSPDTFAPGVKYEIEIYNDNDLKRDIVFTVKFGKVANGQQDVQVKAEGTADKQQAQGRVGDVLDRGGGAPEHPRGQAAAQQVRAPTGRMQIGPVHGALNDGAHGGWADEAAMRCSGADEHPATCASRPVLVHVGGQRLAHVGAQGQPLLHRALTADGDLARALVSKGIGADVASACRP
jgi:hypothetical protein